MTWTAFFLVFGASILHASWNFISKSKRQIGRAHV